MDCILEINLKQIENNYNFIKNYVQSSKISAVLKANAYGFGAEQVFQVLQNSGCRDFFLAYLDESLPLLKHRLPDTKIYIFNGVSKDLMPKFIEHDLTPVLHTPEQVELWKSRNEPCIVHIDTGMNRTGILMHDLCWQNLKNISYLMSHFVSSDVPDDPMNEAQFDRFMQFKGSIPLCLANSRGIFLDSKYHLDMVRPGIVLYGLTNCGHEEIKLCAQLKARVIQVKTIEPPCSIGYNARYRPQKPMRIATLAAGYHDGLPIGLTNTGYVLFDQYKAPIVGQISMDLTTVDVTDVPFDVSNQWATIFGDSITPELWTEWSHQRLYQHVMHINQRVKRIIAA